ncbi:MAG: hypothetical protein E7160_00430 [Firmicutes bacterium]|nr:hypothetical protein [Bacillota bacterium]
MYATDETINKLIEYSKKLYNSTKNNNYNPTIQNMMILSVAAMIYYYGIDNIDAIYNAFNTRIIIGNKNDIIKELEKNKILKTKIKKGIKNRTCKGLCDFKCEYINKNNFGFYKVQPSIYVVNSWNIDYFTLTEYIVHELNHVVNTYNRNILIKNNSYYLRSGLQLDNINSSEIKNKNIDEGINVLQTAEIMNIIRKFSKYKVKDKEISELLKRIKYFQFIKRRGIGYEYTSDIVKELYKDGYFKLISDESRIKGNIEELVDYFDNKTYNGAFNELSKQLDYLPIIDYDLKKIKRIMKRFKEN